MLAHVVDDLAYAREQRRIIKNRLTDRDAILTELSSFSEGCVASLKTGMTDSLASNRSGEVSSR
jgi:hypothetical protein